MRRQQAVLGWVAAVAMTVSACGRPASSGSASPASAQSATTGSTPATVAPTSTDRPPAPAADSPAATPASASPAASPTIGRVRIVRTEPWLDTVVPVRSRVNFAVTLPTPLRAAPPCRLSQVVVVPTAGAAAGSLYGDLRIHNVSATACALAGGLSLALVTDDGVDFASTRSFAAAAPEATVVLVPDSWAMTTPWPLGASCGGQGKTATLRVGLPADEARLTIAFPNGSDTMPAACSGTGKVRRAHPHPGEIEPPRFTPIDHVENYATWSLASVTQSLEVPETVKAGADLSYVVTLAHLAGTGIKAGDGDTGFVGEEDVPLYRQQVGGVGGPSYALNWGPATILHANEGIALRMRLHVPAETPTGPTTLTWQFVEPELPPLTATVTVLAQ